MLWALKFRMKEFIKLNLYSGAYYQKYLPNYLSEITINDLYDENVKNLILFIN